MATAAVAHVKNSLHLVRDGAQSKSKRFYAPELDGLRFLAFLSVFFRHVFTVMGHLHSELQDGGAQAPQAAEAAKVAVSGGGVSTLQGWLQGFDFGVCLFFFLSAFLITRLLLVERQTAGTVSIRDFYMRRILRIWPLYYAFLGLMLIVSVFVPVLHVSGARALAAAFFFANWAAVLHGWSDIAIQPLWSVSVEEQFYLVWPLVARVGRRAITGVAVVCIAAALGTLIYYGNRPGMQMTATWANTLVQSLFLAGGALTACYSEPEHSAISLPDRGLRVLAGIVLWGIASGVFHIVRTESPGPIQLVLGYLSVLAGTYLIFTGVAGMNQFRIPKPVIFLGKISYGLYVFHTAWLILASEAVDRYLRSAHLSGRNSYLLELSFCLLSLVPIIGSAALSYKFLEKPFLKFKERFTVVESRPV